MSTVEIIKDVKDVNAFKEYIKIEQSSIDKVIYDETNGHIIMKFTSTLTSSEKDTLMTHINAYTNPEISAVTRRETIGSAVITTDSTTYHTVNVFVYPDTKFIDTLVCINIVSKLDAAETTTGNPNYYIRIVNITNGNTIGSITLTNNTYVKNCIPIDEELLGTGESLISIQVKKDEDISYVSTSFVELIFN